MHKAGMAELEYQHFAIPLNSRIRWMNECSPVVTKSTERDITKHDVSPDERTHTSLKKNKSTLNLTKLLDQGSAHFFYEGPDGEYFRL